MEKQNSYIFSFSKFILQMILIIGVGGYVLNYFFEKEIIFKSDTNGASKVNRIINLNNSEEIPIFGSSRAEGSYIPSLLFDRECFNYGMSGTQANIWLFFLEEELKKNKTTDIIINLDLEGIVYADGNIGNYIPNYQVTKNILKQKGELYFHVPFIKYFGQYERYFKYYLNEQLSLTKVTDNGGSFEKNKLIKNKFNELVSRRKEASAVFRLEDNLLAKLNNLINSTTRKIFFIVAPYHSSYFEKFKNISEVNKFLFMLNQRENSTVIDLRNLINNDSLFLNTTHVNYKGAVVFSKKVKEFLQKNEIINTGYGPYFENYYNK